MAGAILAQDWNTVRGSVAGTVVTMQESDYVDLMPFQDVVAFLEVSEIFNGINIRFETSPTKDDNLFQLIDASVAFAPTVGVATKVMRYSAVAVPLARFFRWKFSGGATGAWSCTFRLWLSPNLS